MKKLKEYAGKRDFLRTPEPVPGAPGEAGAAEGGRFVVQEHHARRLHWDFRLETGGVLKSWALPRGMPRENGERRLAVEVEDHPLEYLDFQGTIPAGNYGAGEVLIWDRGEYVFLEKSARKIKIILSGELVRGAYVLLKTGKEEKQWLMVKYRQAPDQ